MTKIKNKRSPGLVKSESEELALLIANKAAAKIFPSSRYTYHDEESFITAWGEECERKIIDPLPENAVITQTMLVNFTGTAFHFLIVRLRGIPNAKKIVWTGECVRAPGLSESIISEKELVFISEDFRKKRND